MAALRDADLTGILRHITAPTLVLRGQDDAAVPPEHPALIAKHVESGKLVTVAGGHLSPVEAAGAVCGRLVKHIGNSTRTR